MWRGYGIITELVDGLSRYVEEKGLRSVSELVGRANTLVEPSIAYLETRSGICAHVVQERCRRCDMCVTACQDGGFQAISQGEDGIPVVSPERCDGCGLCFVVCPADALEWQ
jgi:dihydropyrimidine dehydrogenase (NAD+) subunit PreA